MARIKKLTSVQLNNQLRRFSKIELMEFVTELYKTCPDAADYINIELGNEEYEKSRTEETRDKIYKSFFTKGGRCRLSLPVAKDAIARFEGITRNQAAVIDLKLSFVEYAVSAAVRFINFPASFFRDADNMFRDIVKTLSEPDNMDLFEKYDERMCELIESAAGAEGGMQDSLSGMYEQIRWVRERREKERQDLMAEAGEAASGYGSPDDETDSEPHISSKASAGELISEEDSRLYYQLWRPLLEYANNKLHIADIENIDTAPALDPNMVKSVADAVWENPAIIDEYLKEKGNELSADHRYIIRGWKKAVPGKFVVERHLKKGSIFINTDTQAVYLVRGINSTWDEMLWGRRTPVLISATLIPFRDVIISDGLIIPYNIYIGGGMARTFKERYMTAKRRGQLIESL